MAEARCWLAVFLLASSGALAALGEDRPPLEGMPLTEALAVLEAQGLRLVYTDELVRPELEVLEEPSRRDPRGALMEVLRPHGLGVLDGPGGTLVIVAEDSLPAASAVRGQVHWQGRGDPVAGAVVDLEPGRQGHHTDDDGNFGFEDLPPGNYLVTVTPSGFAAETFVPQSVEVEVAAGAALELLIEVTAVPTSEEVIDVFSRPGKVPGEELAVMALGGEEAGSLPSLGGDVFRSLSLLPGSTAAELSAKPQIRGGRDDEVLVRLDGLEILEAYHLKDFGSALSIVPGSVVAQVRLLSGGFPAEFGERMSGVLDLSSRRSSGGRRSAFSVGAFQGSASHGQDLFEGKGHLFAMMRYGYLQIPLRVADEPEDPRFWDLFSRFDHRLSEGHSLRVNLLASGDWLSFEETEEEEDERESFHTSYQNQYLWLTDQRVKGPRLLREWRVAMSRVDTRRDVDTELAEGSFQVDDRRRLEAPSLGHDGYYEASDLQHMKWGLDLRYLDVDYGYRNNRNLTSPLAALRAQPPVGSTVFDRGFHGSQVGVYFADRLTWSRASLEAGLRFDESSITDDEYLSPRLDLGWNLGSRTRLRLAWGHFYQSQRLYELEVADGVDRFQRAERAEHRVIGFQHRFDGRGRRPSSLRVELYERRVTNPRMRFENLADPVSKVPELEPDRILLEPQASMARGVELFASGAAGPVDWFATYAYSRSRDRIDGEEFRRFNDQPHAFSLDLRYHRGPAWDVNLAFQARSGWPITTFGVETATGEDGNPVAVPVLGPLFGDRLETYLRADLQVRKRWRLRKGELELSVNLINLSNRRNARGVSLDFGIEDGVAFVERSREDWQGMLPNFDVSWSF